MNGAPDGRALPTEALIVAAEGRGPLTHARVGVLRELNRNVSFVIPKCSRPREKD
jgi:hypothetical protein